MGLRVEENTGNGQFEFWRGSFRIGDGVRYGLAGDGQLPSRDEALALAHTMAQAVEMRRRLHCMVNAMDHGGGLNPTCFHHQDAKRILAACQPPKPMTPVEKVMDEVRGMKKVYGACLNLNPLWDALAEYEKEKGE